MSTHKMKLRILNAALLTSILTVGLVGTALAVEPVELLLKGHDEPISGYLRQVSEARFLLQGENYYYGFPANQIVTVDGKTEIPESVSGSGRLTFSSFYEKVLPNGDVEIWSHNQITNDGMKVLTGTDWGAAAWEEEQVRAMKVYDAYNNELPVRLIPRGDGSFRVEVDFVVPIAHKESIGLTLKTIRKSAARFEDGHWSYTFNLGFNEDRYLTRKIELPEGAKVLDSYGGCQPIKMWNREVLLSQRYYPAGTVEPLTVSYELP